MLERAAEQAKRYENGVAALVDSGELGRVALLRARAERLAYEAALRRPDAVPAVSPLPRG